MTALAHTLDDHAALARYARTGDPRAFEVLVSRYQAMVLATCRRTLRNDSDAEDATQEAFLRLAQHAGTITSNAAAWLHATALRASLDLLRKRGSAARAERRAGELGERVRKVDSATADWHEIEPLLDEAIGRLDEADRELIVGRFLAGRTQKDMAREAGVNPGTMHRRIERALGRLRTNLEASGLALSGALATAGGLGGVLAAAHAPGAVRPELTGSLVKTGLIGLGRSAGSRGLGLKVGAIAGALVVGAAAIVGATMLRTNATDARAGWVLSTQPAGVAVPRPSKAGDRLAMYSWTVGGDPGATVRFRGDRMVYSVEPRTWDDSVAKPSEATIALLSVTREKRVDRLTVRMESSTFEGDHPAALLVGQTFEILAEPEGDRMTLTIVPPESAEIAEGEDMTLRCARPPAWHPHAAQAIADCPLAPQLGGLWHLTDNFDLVLSKDDVTILYDEWKVHRFRVLSWNESRGVSRVQTICADSMNAALIGDRVKLLLRKDSDGTYALAMHNQYSDRTDEWPEDFAIRPDVDVMVFRKEKP